MTYSTKSRFSGHIGRHEGSTSFILKLARAGIVFLVLNLSQGMPCVKCEAKEFDWSDLGVSLTGPKPSLGVNPTANNLRILISPQRRMTKNYEFEYTNNSQPTSGQTDGNSYMVPNSVSSYQTMAQLSPNHSGHSSAYSALSASLASLKNRLNARGVSSLSDGSNQSNLYPNTGYGSTLLIDPQQQQSPQVQPQSQPTYLSVGGQQDQQSGSSYTVPPNQTSDNKTIVLAIPAKINFLTGSKQQQQQQHIHQQPPTTQPLSQPLTVMQPSNDQQTRSEYPNKQQVGLMAGQEGAVEQNSQIMGRDSGSDQEHHQYVVVNSQAQPNDQHSHLVSANLNPSPVSQTHGQIYSNAYPTIPQANVGTYAMKYLSTYQPAPVQQQPPPVQKVYSVVDSNNGYEPPPTDQSSQSRYTSCADSCNSPDTRYRKYTVPKYKPCCSRQTQYDASLEQPSSEKISEVSSKYADDAYYSYLYRRSRARRARKSRGSNRYHRYPSTSSSSAEEENPTDAESPDATRSNSGRAYDSPYVKYYKNRQPTETAEAPRDEPTSNGNGKYANKERSYRRGRSRDLESQVDSQSTPDSSEDEGSYSRERSRGSSSYGSGEYSVEGGRYPSDNRNPSDEEESRPAYDDAPEAETSKGGVENPDYSAEGPVEAQTEEAESEVSSSYNKYSNPRRRKNGKAKRKTQSSKESKQSKKTRKGKYNKSEQLASYTNGTDYESRPGDYHQEPIPSNDDEQSYQKEPSSENSDQEKDTTSSKYKASLNETAVANLSKTTMHLKEILSLLEKKAQLRANESSATATATQSSVPQTSTAPPVTTTTLYPASIFSNPSYSSSIPTEYITSEVSLKSPYRFDPTSLTSSLSSPSLSLPSSFGSLSSELSSSLSSYTPPQYGLHSKHLTIPNGHHPRRRRVNKNIRYNDLMLQKAHGLGSPSTLLQSASKNRYLTPYYAPLQYPYLYRGSSPSVTNPYPYKNIHKNPYSSLLNGPVSSKLAAAASGGFYSDESRLHGLTSFDPLANVASSLRPSTTMRLRTKPFVFQPQVLPIYTRHTILTPPLDVKA